MGLVKTNVKIRSRLSGLSQSRLTKKLNNDVAAILCLVHAVNSILCNDAIMIGIIPIKLAMLANNASLTQSCFNII